METFIERFNLSGFIHIVVISDDKSNKNLPVKEFDFSTKIYATSYHIQYVEVNGKSVPYAIFYLEIDMISHTSGEAFLEMITDVV